MFPNIVDVFLFSDGLLFRTATRISDRLVASGLVITPAMVRPNARLG
jgi:hypothetical protein